jgi:pimeloyl-ACP methyl ester carboxylesterase
MVITAVGWGIGRTSNTKGLAPQSLDHFTVVSHSPRGSDESTPPVDADGNTDPTQMGSHSMADDLDALPLHLTLPTFPVLMAHSNGAAIAMVYCQKYPGRVDRLICIDDQLIGYNNKEHFDKYRLVRENLPQYKAAYEA